VSKVPLDAILQWELRRQHSIAGWPKRPKPTKAELEEFKALRLAQIAEQRKPEVSHD
jgi:hypothetical protein